MDLFRGSKDHKQTDDLRRLVAAAKACAKIWSNVRQNYLSEISPEAQSEFMQLGVQLENLLGTARAVENNWNLPHDLPQAKVVSSKR